MICVGFLVVWVYVSGVLFAACDFCYDLFCALIVVLGLRVWCVVLFGGFCLVL